MVIKTLLDYCASFHSFKTDKKKLQMGHVTQHHKAINKLPCHIPVGARPTRSCPTAIAPSSPCPPWQGCPLSLPNTKLLGGQQILSFSWRLHSRARQSRRGTHSSPPGPAVGKPSEHWAEWGPLLRCSERLERQLSPCTGSVPLASICCLLPAPHCCPQQTQLAPTGCHPILTGHPWLSCFCAQCSLPCTRFLPRQRGEEVAGGVG